MAHSSSAPRDLDSGGTILRNFAGIFIMSLCIWALTTFAEVIILAWTKIFQVLPFSQEVTELTYHIHDKSDKVFKALGLKHWLNSPIEQGQYSYGLICLLVMMIVGALIRSLLLSFKSWRDAIGNGVAETWDYFHHIDQDHEQAVYPETTFGRSLRRVFMTTLTLCSGGSGGLEGPIIPIGESMGSGFAKQFNIRSRRDLQLFQITGVAAGLTTLLNAPFTAAIFASELFLPEKMAYRYIIYSLFAAVIVYTLNIYTFGSLHVFILDHHSKYYSFKEFLLVCLIAVCFSAPAGLALAKMQAATKRFFQRFPAFIRAPLGATLVFLIVYGCWTLLRVEPYHVIGMGEISLIEVINDEPSFALQAWWVVLLLVFVKMFATSITLQSGGSVGLLIPSMYMGGMTGFGVYQLLASYGWMSASAGPDLYVISGIVSALVTIVDIPLAAIAFVIEVFGANYGPAAMISVIVCYKIASRFK